MVLLRESYDVQEQLGPIFARGRLLCANDNEQSKLPGHQRFHRRGELIIQIGYDRSYLPVHTVRDDNSHHRPRHPNAPLLQVSEDMQDLLLLRAVLHATRDAVAALGPLRLLQQEVHSPEVLRELFLLLF